LNGFEFWQFSSIDPIIHRLCPIRFLAAYRISGHACNAALSVENGTAHMSARDEYRTKLNCVMCGKTGCVDWYEVAHPIIYSGPGIALHGLSEGFMRGYGEDCDGYPEIRCEECKVQAILR